MKYLLFIILLLASTLSFSQTQDEPLVQFSGVIYNADTNTVVPYVSVINKTNGGRTVSASYQGYFSFVAREGDTIIFSSIGYRKEAVVIPSKILDKKYTVVVRMKPMVINLPAVNILPWTSFDDFNRDFMTMKFADDDLEIARKNVSRDKLMALARDLPRDAGEMRSINFRNNHVELSNKNMNMRGANPLLNPFAWGALMKQILEGDKSRSN
ncbi:MAG TPA: hypothetical protein DIT07_07915 [Sphingobacteriaceae bacterium]|nr:hypothetical protein [Sphingobacteriaceae bacterium]